jgi:hypothetical protein
LARWKEDNRMMTVDEFMAWDDPNYYELIDGCRA